MGKQMIQQKGLIKTGVSWFSSQIKRFFKREDSEENKRNHLEDLYDKYEKQTRNHHRKAQSKSKLLAKDKSEVLQTVLRRLRSESGLPQKYLTRRNKIKQYLDSREPFDKYNELVCPICMEFFINPVPTACGHTFCYRCLDNALLFKGGCPVCRCYLRGQELSPCLAVNNIVRMYLNYECRHIRKSCKPEQIETYEARLRDTEDWQQKKRLPQSLLVVGEKLDVRDTEYIWCKGFILNVYRKGDIVTELLIHYQGWNKIYDEILELSSPRLAPLGYFTSRDDIPRYALSENYETYYSYVISGPQPPPMVNEQQQPEEVEPEEADNVEQPEQPSADIENSGSQQHHSEIELENDLNNRLEEANLLVTNINIAVSSLQERLMLRNILSEMGLSNLGNMINLNELGTGANNQQQGNQQEVIVPDMTGIDVQVNLMPRELIHSPQEIGPNANIQTNTLVQPHELASGDEHIHQQYENQQLPNIEIRLLPPTSVISQLQLLATTTSTESNGQTSQNPTSTN